MCDVTEFGRPAIVIASLSVHICVGTVYSWSVFNTPLAKACPEWVKGASQYVFSTAIVCLGLTASFGGRLLEKKGPRIIASVAAILWSIGQALGAIAVATQVLPLLFIGYGVIGGVGVGLAYISPVSTMIKWFPKNKGLAAGIAVMGFGAGSVIGSPSEAALIATVGPAATLGIFSAISFVVMLIAAQFLRFPPPHDSTKLDSGPPQPVATAHGGGPGSMTLGQALKTWQFWVMWSILFLNITAGIAILSNLSNMVQELFGKTPAVAAIIVSIAGGCNAFGRIFWATFSDCLGRRPIFCLFFTVQSVLFAILPSLIVAGSYTGFVVIVGVIMSMYGAGFACIPAFLADMFGSKNVGAVHGVILTAWSGAGAAGPILITTLHNYKIARANGVFTHIYDDVLYIFCGVLALGLILSLAIRPIKGASNDLSGRGEAEAEMFLIAGLERSDEKKEAMLGDGSRNTRGGDFVEFQDRSGLTI